MGPKLIETTEKCSRCSGTGNEPLSHYKICIRCEGKKIITQTTIEIPPTFYLEILSEMTLIRNF